MSVELTVLLQVSGPPDRFEQSFGANEIEYSLHTVNERMKTLFGTALIQCLR